MSDSTGFNKKPHTFEDTLAEVRAHEEWGAINYYRLFKEAGKVRVIRLYNQDAYLFDESDFATPHHFENAQVAEIALKLFNDTPLTFMDKTNILDAMANKESE
jgi:hypothetical protein